VRNLTRMNLLKCWHLSRRTFINLLLIYRPDVKLIANRKICYPDFYPHEVIFDLRSRINGPPKVYLIHGPDRINFIILFKMTYFSQLEYISGCSYGLMSIYKLFMEKSKHQLLVPYILIRTLLISFRLFETETVLHWLMS